MIPEIIHFIWIQGENNIPRDLKNNFENLKNLNKNYEIILWNDEKIRELLYKYPEILELYKNASDIPGENINYFATMSDIARWVIVYEYGGIYMDLDVECIDTVNNIIKNFPRKNNIFGTSKKLDMFSGQFFIASPKHDILKKTIENLQFAKNKGEIGGTMTHVIHKYTGENLYIIPEDDVSFYHCGLSSKCMIPIKNNSSKTTGRDIYLFYCKNKKIIFPVIFFLFFIFLLITIIVLLKIYYSKN